MCQKQKVNNFSLINPIILEDYIHFTIVDSDEYKCKINLDSMRWVEISLNSGTYYLRINGFNYKAIEYLKNKKNDEFFEALKQSMRFENFSLTHYIRNNNF